MLDNVSELIRVVEEIQVKTGLTIGDISVKAGYGSNYISEAISKKNVSKKLLNKIKGILDSEGDFIKDAAAWVKKKLSFHISRHSIAFHLKQSEVPVGSIKDILGHSDTATTERYLKALDDEMLDNEMRKVYG